MAQEVNLCADVRIHFSIPVNENQHKEYEEV